MSTKIKKYCMDYGNKKYKDKITLAKKLDLFDEYIEKTGSKIDGKTVYKGIPIGRMLIQLRSAILRKKVNYSDEVIKRLEKNGLLDRSFESTEEKVSRLEKYCENNSQLWYLRAVLLGKYLKTSAVDFVKSNHFTSDDDMRRFLKEYQITPVIISENADFTETSIELAIEEFKKAVNDYLCLVEKHGHNVLKTKYAKRLKDAGVGGVFGYKPEIEELSKEIGIDAERLNQILIDFGSLDNFREIYIKFITTWEVWKNGNTFGLNKFKAENEYVIRTFGSLKKFDKFKKHFRYLAKANKLITFFDLTQDGFVPIEENRTLAYIVGLEYILGSFFDGKALENLSNSFTSQESDIIEELLEGKGKKSFADVAREHNLSKTRIMQIKNEVVRKIIIQVNNPVWSVWKSEIRRRKFIKRYFESKDIFITSESFDLSEDLKQELLKIIGVTFDKEGNMIFESEDLTAELGELIEDLHLAYQELSQDIEDSQILDRGSKDAKEER